MNALSVLLLAFFVLCSFPRAFALPGDLDVSFGTGGKVVTPVGTGEDRGHAVGRQSDGKIVVGGYSHNGSNKDFAVLRYNVDGTPMVGLTWDDRGALSNDDSGDPSLVWRRLDGKFSYAALRNGGLGLYRSDDDCQSFVFVSQIASGSDDKEIMAIDNDPASPFYGRIYIVWVDFGSGSRIHSIYSTNAGASWSTQLAVSPAGRQCRVPGHR